MAAKINASPPAVFIIIISLQETFRKNISKVILHDLKGPWDRITSQRHVKKARRKASIAELNWK